MNAAIDTSSKTASTRVDCIAYFIYDNTGSSYALVYNGTVYYYILNQQGDVIRIVNTSGTAVATYAYNAWGECIFSSGTLAAVNPIRYRGYYYDAETGFYYLQSRYYDPAIGRFINADDTSNLAANGDFTSLNLFTYCGNNPVSRSDDGGQLWHVVFGAVVGGLASGISKYLECKWNGESTEDAVKQALVSAAFGALGGGLAATGIGQIGQTIIGGALGAAEYVACQTVANKPIDAIELVSSTVSGLMGGAHGKDGASYGSKFMSYHRSQFAKNSKLYGVSTALSKFTKHTWNWSKSNLIKPTAQGVAKAFIANKACSYYMGYELSRIK